MQMDGTTVKILTTKMSGNIKSKDSLPGSMKVSAVIGTATPISSQ